MYTHVTLDYTDACACEIAFIFNASVCSVYKDFHKHCLYSHLCISMYVAFGRSYACVRMCLHNTCALFLVADTQLYKRLRPSVRRLVGRSVGRLVGRSVTLELKSGKTRISAPALPSATDGRVSDLVSLLPLLPPLLHLFFLLLLLLLDAF